jgi:hypothetical protein
MAVPTLSDVTDRVQRVAELIRRLETAEDSVKTLPSDNVRVTVTNCLEVALKTLREDRSKMENPRKDSQSDG